MLVRVRLRDLGLRPSIVAKVRAHVMESLRARQAAGLPLKIRVTNPAAQSAPRAAGEGPP